MSDASVSLSRQELYDQVWSEPMTELAPKLGLSDAGLAKVCRKYCIPKPPIGHWEKLEHGKAFPMPELPELDNADLQEIRFFRDNFDAGPTSEANPEPKIVVSERLAKPHRLVDKARDKLRVGEPDHRGLVSVHNERCLDVSVTRKSLTRALRLLDALIKHWESSGGSVSAGEPATTFAREADRVSIALTEQIIRHEKPSQYRYSKDYTYEPTGKLTLSIDGWGDGTRRTWSDGKVQRLENVLGKVAQGLEAWVLLERDRRLDKECEARQERLALQARRVTEISAKAESDRRENLEACVDGWVKAERIRAYLKAFEAKLESKTLQVNNPDAFSRWRAWADWYADYVCPITPNYPAPDIDEPVVHTNRSISDLDLTTKTRHALVAGGIDDTDELSTLSRDDVKKRCGDRHYPLYREITRVLEGLGYDVADRSRL